MAKAKEKDAETRESVKSILGKIRSVVSGKEKVVVEDEVIIADVAEDEEPMELTEIVEGTVADEAHQNPAENMSNTEISAESDDADGPEFVDLLQEIDQVLEKQYKDDDTQAAITPAADQEIVKEPEAIIEQPVVNEPINANLAQDAPQNEPIKQAEVKKEFPQAVSQNIIANQVARDMTENKPNILSEDIASKSSKAIQNLLNNIPRTEIDSPAFRSATTLEDVVTEMIRPMLKEWLDKNLEAIVSDIVEKEIKKIIPRD